MGKRSRLKKVLRLNLNEKNYGEGLPSTRLHQPWEAPFYAELNMSKYGRHDGDNRILFMRTKDLKWVRVVELRVIGTNTIRRLRADTMTEVHRYEM